MINERIEYLRNAQTGYREMEVVLLDKKLSLQLQKRQLVRMHDKLVGALVCEGLLERVAE